MVSPSGGCTAQFRTRFKDAIMCANAIATGFGTTISQAGLPRAGASVASADACGGLPEWEVLYILSASGCAFLLSFTRSLRDVFFTLLLRTLLYFSLCFSVVNKYIYIQQKIGMMMNE